MARLIVEVRLVVNLGVDVHERILLQIKFP